MQYRSKQPAEEYNRSRLFEYDSETIWLYRLHASHFHEWFCGLNHSAHAASQLQIRQGIHLKRQPVHLKLVSSSSNIFIKITSGYISVVDMDKMNRYTNTPIGYIYYTTKTTSRNLNFQNKKEKSNGYKEE